MPDGQRLYLRDAELIVGPRVEGKRAPEEPATARSFRGTVIGKEADGKQIGGFRISFAIKKEQTAEPNKAKISIYNVSQETRNFFEQKNLVLFLKAGYVGSISTIFFGDVIDPITERKGADIVTTLECGDQEQILLTAFLQIGFGPGVTNVQLFEAAEEALNLRIPANQKARIPVRPYNRGFSFTGTAQTLLRRLTKEIGFRFSVQDGEIQLIGKDADEGREAVLVSPSTGLIGFPTKTKEGVRFSTLIIPEIRPGRLVKLESKQFQGALTASSKAQASDTLSDAGALVVARKVEINGDTHEGPWEMAVEADTKVGE